jgi:hypothetical protein
MKPVAVQNLGDKTRILQFTKTIDYAKSQPSRFKQQTLGGLQKSYKLNI